MHPKFKQIYAPLLLLFLLTACKKNFENKTTANENIVGMQAAGKPNIVLIIGDDIGYETITVNGGRSYSTPNLDKLASSGMRFTQMRAAPLCSPSRFMLLTGKYNFRNYSVWGKMDTTEHTIGNMLKDAGYATCYAGKWQLDGGDNSIHKLGFDKYSVWLPFKVCPEEAEGSRYKSTKIYENGSYLPDSITTGNYSEDFFSSYVLNFIDSNQSKPFFVYYSMILGHKPHSPTPEDAEYAAWNPDTDGTDTAFYPSMVKYMDEKIGLIMQKIYKLGLQNNTIIIYVGDNGTQRDIISDFRNTTIPGGKGSTIEYGIHVPLFCSWPGSILPNKVNGSVIDFTDFMPTLAGIAGIPVPTDYGTLDGTSFYPQLVGGIGTVRNAIFTQFNPSTCVIKDSIWRYAQDSVYKLYDDGRFINFKTDVFEVSPLADSVLTAKQKKIKRNLQNVINEMHN